MLSKLVFMGTHLPYCLFPLWGSGGGGWCLPVWGLILPLLPPGDAPPGFGQLLGVGVWSGKGVPNSVSTPPSFSGVGFCGGRAVIDLFCQAAVRFQSLFQHVELLPWCVCGTR